MTTLGVIRRFAGAVSLVVICLTGPGLVPAASAQTWTTADSVDSEAAGYADAVRVSISFGTYRSRLAVKFRSVSTRYSNISLAIDPGYRGGPIFLVYSNQVVLQRKPVTHSDGSTSYPQVEMSCEVRKTINLETDVFTISVANRCLERRISLTNRSWFYALAGGGKSFSDHYADSFPKISGSPGVRLNRG